MGGGSWFLVVGSWVVGWGDGSFRLRRDKHEYDLSH
jgi:hypothetical protein